MGFLGEAGPSMGGVVRRSALVVDPASLRRCWRESIVLVDGEENRPDGDLDDEFGSRVFDGEVGVEPITPPSGCSTGRDLHVSLSSLLDLNTLACRSHSGRQLSWENHARCPHRELDCGT